MYQCALLSKCPSYKLDIKNTSKMGYAIYVLIVWEKYILLFNNVSARATTLSYVDRKFLIHFKICNNAIH